MLEDRWDRLVEENCGYRDAQEEKEEAEEEEVKIGAGNWKTTGGSVKEEDEDGVNKGDWREGWRYEAQEALNENYRLHDRAKEKRMWYAERYTRIVEEEREMARREKEGRREEWEREREELRGRQGWQEIDLSLALEEEEGRRSEKGGGKVHYGLKRAFDTREKMEEEV